MSIVALLDKIVQFVNFRPFRRIWAEYGNLDIVMYCIRLSYKWIKYYGSYRLFTIVYVVNHVRIAVVRHFELAAPLAELDWYYVIVIIHVKYLYVL